MGKIMVFLRQWSTVIVLAMYIAAMVCAFLCCIFSKGWIYPTVGAVGVAASISASVYQLVGEIKRVGGL